MGHEEGHSLHMQLGQGRGRQGVLQTLEEWALSAQGGRTRGIGAQGSGDEGGCSQHAWGWQQLPQERQAGAGTRGGRGQGTGVWGTLPEQEQGWRQGPEGVRQEPE